MHRLCSNGSEFAIILGLRLPLQAADSWMHTTAEMQRLRMCLALTLPSHVRLAGIASGRRHQSDVLMQALQHKVILQNLDDPCLQAHQTHISCCVNLVSLSAGMLYVAHVM